MSMAFSLNKLFPQIPALPPKVQFIKIKFVYQDKKEEIWLSPMTKAPTPTEMSKGQWQHKQRHKKVRLNSGCGPT